MQTLNVQFLQGTQDNSQKACSKKTTDTSFKSMIEEAESPKKTVSEKSSDISKVKTNPKKVENFEKNYEKLLPVAESFEGVETVVMEEVAIKETNEVQVLFDLSQISLPSQDDSVSEEKDTTEVYVQKDLPLEQAQVLYSFPQVEKTPIAQEEHIVENEVAESIELLPELPAQSPKDNKTDEALAFESQDSTVLEDVLSDSNVTLVKNEEGQVAKKDSKSQLSADNKTESSHAPVFTITDLRTATENSPTVQDDKKKIDVDLEGPSLKEKTAVSPETFRGEAIVRNGVEQNILSSNSQSAGASGSVFQQMLTEQISQNAPEFVKAGSILLRDNNSGTINMTMKPESLGNVKISLELSDKVIAGQITVNSREAYEAFRQNLDTLKNAFQQSGFDSAAFTLNLTDNSATSAFAQGGQQGQTGAEQFMSNKTYGNFASNGEGSSNVTETNTAYAKSGDYRIDVVA